jgi:hypothetical protein
VRAIDVAVEGSLNLSPAVTSYPQGNARRAAWTFDEADFDAYGKTGLTLASRHMDRLATFLGGRRIRLVVAVYPWPDQIRHDDADSIQVVFWREWAARRGVRFIDLFAPFYANGDREAAIRDYFISGDIHFNVEGSRMISRAFLAAFQ